ncbi:ATP-binding cassette domain-containing protein [Agaribacter marinus]|uniref:ATP-binding cassette domain-containing protein n=1 Tax=Virgibacillus salarius TaxID=447199 RepID=A0A941E2G7_9BACI|nr:MULTISPECIES: ATP-binding cassette domain-containing protein [Bacillaceae]MBR7797663.1 ATP-binding cassette domain-containing protein [Virgibacillus salarius]NAZ10373.1 ATP-binding cassette domain-containing protein [Agaribacter marinus]WBX81933.1 ATP-binding cassette domain-containing protein [Virgibacillus salarius]
MKKKVELKNVYKSFDLYSKKSEKLLNLLSLKKEDGKQFLALRDITFEIFEGETVGIVGLNGSGKSTVSNILAGVLQPTEGIVNIKGKSSLIAISAGLNNNLSGMDNIKLKCIMLGLSKEKVEEVTPFIIDFADIGDYIYQPVKEYSSGMKSRLGFAISVHTNPDILIIDEALSVGDSTFTQKCLNKMKEFKEEGKTIFFISHSASQMKSFCEKVIWMHYGQIKEIGDSDKVVDNYQKFTKWFNSLTDLEKKTHKKEMLDNQITNAEINKIKTKKKSFGSIIRHSLVVIPVIILGILLVFNGVY